MPKFTRTDKKFMNIAFDLALKGKNRVFPNPMVGAVLVNDGIVVGKGYHKYFGGPHAEVYALEEAGTKAMGAVLYVTLEPCAHWGKTAPCADSIIKAGVSRVVASSADPNPKTAGKGFKKLKASNIKVHSGLMKADNFKLNSSYFKRFPVKKSRVIVKTAMSLDGKIATRTGDSKWISSERSRKMVHELRSRQDAIIVGINTVLKDNPRLTSHGMGNNPVRVVIDPELKVPLNSFVLNNEASTVIFTSSKVKAKHEVLRKMGIMLISCPKTVAIDFKYIIKQLNIMSIYRILIEGGGETIAKALEAGVVNEFLLFIGPKLIGGRDAKTPVEGLGSALVSNATKVRDVKVRSIGQDILITGRIN